MSGFPTRPDRNAFGQTMQNSGAVRDPSRHLDASVWNLMAWQVAGLGLIVPRAMLYFTANASPAILARAEAWNPKREGSGAYADPGFTVNGAGDYTVAWPSSIPDELGNSLSLAFSFAQAFTVNADPSVVKKAQAAVVGGNPYQIRVCVFSASNALEHGNDVVVLGY
jgi:hypothetical protein